MRNLLLALLAGSLLSGCGSAPPTTSQVTPTPAPSGSPAQPAVNQPPQPGPAAVPKESSEGAKRANGSTVEGADTEMKDEKDAGGGGALKRPGTSATPAHNR